MVECLHTEYKFCIGRLSEQKAHQLSFPKDGRSVPLTSYFKEKSVAVLIGSFVPLLLLYAFYS